MGLGKGSALLRMSQHLAPLVESGLLKFIKVRRPPPQKLRKDLSSVLSIGDIGHSGQTRKENVRRNKFVEAIARDYSLRCNCLGKNQLTLKPVVKGI